LREFRDRFLLTNITGRWFVDLYYTYSPPVAAFIAQHDTLRALVRWGLLPLVGISYVTLQHGSVVTLTFMLMLFALVIGAAVCFMRRLGTGRHEA
jgi:hypothetical protein